MEDLEDIYRGYFDPVYRYALSLCRDAALAEEITQETFFRAMEGLDGFRGGCSAYAWLCRIAKNAYFSLLRKRRHRADGETVPDTADPAPGPEEALLTGSDAQRLHRLLHELREPYKEVFTLRVFGELPFGRIGELFGKSDSWARLIFYRAKNELRRQMDESDM